MKILETDFIISVNTVEVMFTRPMSALLINNNNKQKPNIFTVLFFRGASGATCSQEGCGLKSQQP